MNSTQKIVKARASLLFLFVILAAGCTPSQNAQVVIQTQVVEVTPLPPTPAPGAVKYNRDVKGNITLWHFWGSPIRHNAIRRVIAECQQNLPNINVTEEIKPFLDIWKLNSEAVTAGAGMPDVIVSDRPALSKDAANGVYVNLQPFADRDGIKRDQFYPWAWDETLYGGNTYGIPHETDVRVLFWNKTIFKEAGLDPKKPPTTWDELEAFADKLDKKGADGKFTRIAFLPLWNADVQPVWTAVNGTQLIAPDGTPQINNPKVVETLQWVKEWVDRYGGWQAVQDFHAQHNEIPNDLFMSSSVAMFVDIFGYNSQLEFYRPRVKLDKDNDPINDPRMEWGVGQIPNNGTPANWSGGFAMSIPSGSKHTDAAWEFIKCATSTQGQTSWARDTQAQPTNIIASQSAILQSNPFWKVVNDALKVSTGSNYVSKYPTWYEQLSQRYEKVWLGELTPEQALDEAQAAVVEAIK